MNSTGGIPLFLFALAILFGVLLIGCIVVYNRFRRLQNHVHESWSNIDVLLKRRYELIPNLVQTVEAYAHHEKGTLTAIRAARDRALASVGSVLEQARDEENLVTSVNTLLHQVERYPELQASAQFLNLQKELALSEDRIAAARRLYNANVRDFNIALESFPSSMIGGVLGIHRNDFFEVDAIDVREFPALTKENPPTTEMQ